MGQYLTIYPCRGIDDLSREEFWTHDCLTFEQDCELLDLILWGDDERGPVEMFHLPPGLQVVMDEGGEPKRTRRTRHGDDLVFAYAAHLKRLRLSKNASFRDQAIKAYIDALPDDLPIILEWW